MNETDIRNSLYNYLAIFRSFGNCGIDDIHGYNYWFKTTSESKLYLRIDSDYIELYDCSFGSSKLISRCDYKIFIGKII